MTVRVLSTRALNRALLARQLLLERAEGSLEAALEQVGGLQTQYAPSGYVGLWTRLAAFQRDDLTHALEERRVVQATLLRATIHLVTASDFWRYALGCRVARRAWSLQATGGSEADRESAAARLRMALADGPRTVRELGGIVKGFVGAHGLWVDLVRVPPSGTWERRRADRLALAEAWIGPPDVSQEEAEVHLVRAYLRAFGPAPWRAIASWAGIGVEDAKRRGAELDLVTYRDEDGGQLFDVRGAVLPDPATPAPVRFLPHWDAVLLVHARRSGVLPEPSRSRVFTTRNPFSMGTVLVDGRVVAGWSVREGRVVVESFDPIPADAADEVEAERAALEAFHA